MNPTERRGRGKSARSRRLIAAAAEILDTIQPATVRAVCYQLFTHGLIANMGKNETNRVSTQLRDAREAGAIPWNSIVDETREPERVSAWADPAAYVEAVKRSYRRDRWLDQPVRIEAWSEKGTVRGTLSPVLNTYGVTFRVMHGYGSATTVHQVADESRQDDRGLTVFYVGDWDPSGLHMSAVDLPQRLAAYGGRVQLHRVALDDEDVHRGRLPSFEAQTKQQDPRYAWFVSHYGQTCWELDALNPVLLRCRLEQAIHDCLDLAAWSRAEAAERAETESLADILSKWPGSSGQASKCGGAAR